MHLSLLLTPILALLAEASYPKDQQASWSHRPEDHSASWSHDAGHRQASSSWPYSPFVTSGRDIINTRNETVVYAGVNWPGAADVMIPEGLQYQSISTILSKIKSLGMNSIRLTYAIEMIDDIYEGVDSSLETACKTALGTENGTTVLGQILDNNPAFTANTTRLQVYDAIAAEAYKQEIYVHLDNHVSKGEWCCSHTDGNAWFGDTYFNVTNWKRGLAFMAKHVEHWPALTSMSLRNELRSPSDPTSETQAYTWPVWYKNMVSAADGINAANPAPLIFFSGLNYDVDLSAIVNATDLGNGTRFLLSDFSYKDKIVFELHNYENGATNCSEMENTLYEGGYKAMDLSANLTNTAPVVLTEFGFTQDNSTYLGVYAQCLKNYLTGLEGGPGGWMQWVISGSYYIREGAQDTDETWALLNHNWTDWRSEAAAMNFTKAWVEETL